jgi:hypothetical protein
MELKRGQAMAEQKYELTGTSKVNEWGVTVHQIRALVDPLRVVPDDTPEFMTKRMPEIEWTAHGPAHMVLVVRPIFDPHVNIVRPVVA